MAALVPSSSTTPISIAIEEWNVSLRAQALLSDAVREALFLRIIWQSFTGKTLSVPTLLHEDNMGAIAWGHNPVDFARSKHIEVSVSAVREQIQEFKTVKLQYIPTVRQLADTLTKNTVPAIFTALRKGLLGIRNMFRR